MERKIVILTLSQSQSKYEVGRVVKEAEKMGIGLRRALYSELEFEMGEAVPTGRQGGLKAYVGGEEINEKNTMAVWFRVAGTESGKYVEARNLLIRILDERVFCANGESYLKWPRMGKIAQYGQFIINSIPVVESRLFFTKRQVTESRMVREGELGWPVIVKDEKGFQGKSVFRLESGEEVGRWLDKAEEKDIGLQLWQRYLPTRWDIRVIVLGGKAIGAMRRRAVGEEFRSNFSLGGKVDDWELSDMDREIAERVAEVCGLDYGGVDIMKDGEDNSYVLEVNRACQFQGFEKATGINVGKMVVEMLLSKAKRI